MPNYRQVNKNQPGVKKSDCFASDDANNYDVDNYASIDSQLGKYDINFKDQKKRP